MLGDREGGRQKVGSRGRLSARLKKAEVKDICMTCSSRRGGEGEGAIGSCIHCRHYCILLASCLY